MHSFIEHLNQWAERALHFAWPMLWQSSLLIVLVFALDYALRGKVRAAIRYGLWLIVLVKLVVPPSLALPTGLAWWLRQPTPTPAQVSVTLQPTPLENIVVVDANQPRPALPLPQPTVQLTATAALPPPSISVSGAVWVLGAWVLISFGLFVWLGVRWRQVAKHAGGANPAPVLGASGNLNELFASAKHLAGVRETVSCRLIDQPVSPAVCGLFRPVVLLPRTLAEQLPAPQLRAILLHELIHLRRRDVWVNCLQALLQIFYWWHPLLWLANARIRRLREEAVDDAVMLALADESDAYAPTLLEVAKLSFSRPLTALGLVGILESRRGLRQRIERLMNFKTPRRAGLSVVSLLAIASLTAFAVPMGEAPKKPTASSPALTSAEDRSRPVASAPGQPGADATHLVMAASINSDAATGITVLSNDVVILSAGRTMFADSAIIDNRRGELIARRVRMNLLPSNSVPLASERISFAFGASELRLELLAREPGGSNYTNAAYQKVSEEAKRLVPLKEVFSNRLIYTSKGRQGILNKLDRIRIETVFFDNLPLSEVVRVLNEEAKKRDPERNGINFLINPQQADAIDINTVTVRINPALKDVRMADVLDAIVQVADHSIKYSLEDHAVVFSLKGQETTPLVTRRLKVDPIAFERALQRFDPAAFDQILHQTNTTTRPVVRVNGVAFVTNFEANASTLFLRFFAAAGVDLNPSSGMSIFYKDRDGTMLVRASADDLDRLEKLLANLESWPVAPGVPPFERKVKAAEFMMNGRLLYELNKLDEAEEQINKALALEPESEQARSLLNQVREARRSQQVPRRAPQALNQNETKLIQVTLTNGEIVDLNGASEKRIALSALVRHGRLFLELGELDQAECEFKKALEIEPTLLAARSNLATVQARRRQPPASPQLDQNEEHLLVRTFKVDPNTIYQWLEAISWYPGSVVEQTVKALNLPSASGTNVISAAKRLFRDMGVNLAPPKALDFNDREGSLVVRATATDLAMIEAGLQTLSVTPPGISINATFIKLPAKTANEFWAKWFPAGDQGNGACITTLTPIAKDELLKELKSIPDVSFAIPDVQATTLSGRQAQLQIEDYRPRPYRSPDTGRMRTNMQPTLSTLDIIPYADPDGKRIQMTLLPTTRVFIGYDDPGAFVISVQNAPPGAKMAPMTAQLPLPRFRIRQVKISAIVPDGHTILLGRLRQMNFASDTGTNQPAFAPQDTDRNVLMLITPRLVNPAGNRLNPK